MGLLIAVIVALATGVVIRHVQLSAQTVYAKETARLHLDT